METQRARVLYVDDTAVNLKLFAAVFRKDYEILTTEYPEKVLQILEKEDVQVLVSDQRMPGITGIELLETVAEKHPQIRRFLLTAFTDAETVIEAVNVGRIHGYIAKPFNNDDVRKAINASLEVYYLRLRNREILEELEEANEKLLNLDGLKSGIIESISNEISQPLSQIMGTLHLLKSKIEGEELTNVVRVLDQSVVKLEEFALLARQISALKSPGYSLQKEELSFDQVIQYASIEVAEELKAKNIKVMVDSETEDTRVEGNRDLLVSCMVNMFRFGRDHCQPDEVVHLRMAREEGAFSCEIWDDGNYAPEDDKVRMESMYGDRDAPLDLGMGIGLAVSKMIMEAHGGGLIYQSKEANSGSIKLIFSNE